MRTIHHVLDVPASPTRVYEALTTGLAGWWSTEVDTATEVGGVIHFTFTGDFNPRMRITELRPEELLAWHCVGGHEPWADATFRFELADLGKPGTRLRFWQEYATELSDDAYGTYNYNWGYYLESLRLLCESGAGKPFQPG